MRDQYGTTRQVPLGFEMRPNPLYLHCQLWPGALISEPSIENETHKRSDGEVAVSKCW